MRVERSPPLIVAEVGGRYATCPPLVVDCSVIAAVIFGEPKRDEVTHVLSAKVGGGPIGVSAVPPTCMCLERDRQADVEPPSEDVVNVRIRPPGTR
jgi:hypothetical protein